MVNGPSELDAETARTAIGTSVGQHLNPGGIVVVDTVQDPAYRYNHRIEDLTPEGCTATTWGSFPRRRELWQIAPLKPSGPPRPAPGL
jgi:hypothetical protein